MFTTPDEFYFTTAEKKLLENWHQSSTSVGVTEADLSSVPSVVSLPKKHNHRPKTSLGVCKGGPPQESCGVKIDTVFFFELTTHVVKGTKDSNQVFLRAQVSSAQPQVAQVQSTCSLLLASLGLCLSGLTLKFCVNDVISNLRVLNERFWTL